MNMVASPDCVFAEIVVEKNLGTALGNILRHIAFTQVPYWRPIAYSLNRDLNYIHAGEGIAEDAWAIMTSLASMRFVPKNPLSNEDMLIDYDRYTGQLKVGNFKSEYFSVSSEEEDLPIITPLNNDSVDLKIIYRSGTGNYTNEDNKGFLLSKGVNLDGYFVISSRHTEIKDFSFTVEHGSTNDTLKIRVDSGEGTYSSSAKFLEKTLSIFKGIVGSMNYEIK